MEDKYLDKNLKYWTNGYHSPNLESFVFRLPNLIKDKLKFQGSNLLDYGCGQGEAMLFFKKLGFNVYGVDISKKNIDVCKEKGLKNVRVIHPKPRIHDKYFNVEFDIILSIQTLYYLNDKDLQIRLITLQDMLRKYGLVYFTMISTSHYLFNNPIKNLYINFTRTKNILEEKFYMFTPLTIGRYNISIDSIYKSRKHYTFLGVKI